MVRMAESSIIQSPLKTGGASKIGVIGSGPAGLLAASQALKQGAEVHIFERRPGLGRKLLIAGSSGLNVSYDAPIEKFLEFYQHRNLHHYERLEPIIRSYDPQKWLQFIQSLGHEVFKGTSRRWFVREMKASKLLSSWSDFIRNQGGQFHTDREWIGLHQTEARFRNLKTGVDETKKFDALILACGGGSWESSQPVWPSILSGLGISISPFQPSNVGYEIDFSEELLKEAEGRPIKNCILKTDQGEKRGELVITRYGIEGTPVYFVGTPGEASLDFRPDLSHEDLLKQLSRPLRENLSPFRRVKKLGGLGEGALALLFHHLSESDHLLARTDLKKLATFIKNFPLKLKGPRSLSESISSSGGLHWDELDESLMLLKVPGVFVCGEMIEWDAPTGGFLIQASVSQGYHAANSAVCWVRKKI